MRAHVLCFAVGLAAIAVGMTRQLTHISEPYCESVPASETAGAIGTECVYCMSSAGMAAWVPIGLGVALLVASLVLWARHAPSRRRAAQEPGERDPERAER